MRIRAELNTDEVEELLRPKLKLFLSVDVVGSSDFKQRSDSNHAHHWLNLFVSFYSTFPGIFDAAVAELSTTASSLKTVRLWKALGDELIFTVELSARGQAGAYLKAFRLALQRASENWHGDDKHPDRQELWLKGTAWLAGFPLTNSEMLLDISNPGPQIDCTDYIGPLIDTGFRIKHYATPRKLVLSADLAYLLVSSGTSGLHLFFDGDEPLKGIMRGKPYPIIWMDCDGHNLAHDQKGSARMNRLKDGLMGRDPVNDDNLRQFLGLWIDGTKGRINRPFIFTDPFEDLIPPVGYGESLAHVRRDLHTLFNIAESTTQPSSGETEVPEAIQEFLASK